MSYKTSPSSCVTHALPCPKAYRIVRDSRSAGEIGFLQKDFFFCSSGPTKESRWSNLRIQSLRFSYADVFADYSVNLY